jgi:hypothetical protein
LTRAIVYSPYDQLPTEALLGVPGSVQMRKKLPALTTTPGVPDAPGRALAFICGIKVPPPVVPVVMMPLSCTATCSVAEVEAAVTTTAVDIVVPEMNP